MQEIKKGGHALVTGASGGIGRAIAKKLAQNGYSLSLLGRDKDKLTEVKNQCLEYVSSVDIYSCDFEKFSNLSIVVEGARESLGNIDILINNAGVGYPGVVGEVDVHNWHRMVAVNLSATMELTHLCVPDLKKSKQGAVINIASIAGKLSFARGAGYCASKHGVVGYSGALFEDLRDCNIKVCAICPGYVNTEMVAKRNLDSNKMIQPEDIANTVIFVLSFGKYACPTEIIIRPQQTVA